MGENTVIIQLTAATVIDGQIQRAGTKVEMVESEAKNLLRLGKAELLSAPVTRAAADDKAAAQAAAAAPAASTAPQAAPAAPVAGNTSGR